MSEIELWREFFISIAEGDEWSRINELFTKNQSLFLNAACPDLGYQWVWKGWSAPCIAASSNLPNILLYFIHNCGFDVHFINQSPHTEKYAHYQGASILHFVADDRFGVYNSNAEAQFDMLNLLIQNFHVNEQITTKYNETYRDFLAKRNRPKHYDNQQNYQNRLENFNKYLIYKITLFICERNYEEAAKILRGSDFLHHPCNYRPNTTKMNEQNEEIQINDDEISVLYLIADDKRKIFGKHENAQFKLLYLVIQQLKESNLPSRERDNYKNNYRELLGRSRSRNFKDYHMTRKIKNLFKEKNYEIGDQKNRNSSLILNLIADDKWGIFADNEDSQFSILHYFSKFNNDFAFRNLLAERQFKSSKGYVDSAKYVRRLFNYDRYLILSRMKSFMNNNEFYEAAQILHQYNETTKQNENVDSDIVQQIAFHIKKVNPIRVNILGSAEAGKSTLVEMVIQLLANKKNGCKGFSVDKHKLGTDGIKVTLINDGEFAFWDFGGQEVLYSTHEFFLSEEVQFILVVDYSKLISKDSKTQNRCLVDTKYWISQIKFWTINQRSAPIIIVGTHCDVITKKSMLSRHKDEYIIEAEKKLTELVNSEKLNISIMLRITTTDCEADTDNLNSLFTNLRHNATNFIYPMRNIISTDFSSKPIDLSYTIMRLCIEEVKKQRKYLMWEEYIKLFHSFHIRDYTVIKKITQFLVNYGAILTYRQYSSGGGSLVIIDPIWLATAFTSIISISFLESSLRRGYFTQKQLETNWSKLQIDKSVWGDLLKLFEALHLIVKRPLSNEVYSVHNSLITTNLLKTNWTVTKHLKKEHRNDLHQLFNTIASYSVDKDKHLDTNYYVPAMLRTPHKLSNKDYVTVQRRDHFIKNESVPKNYQCISRTFQFTPLLKFGFIDLLVVRILQFPGMDVKVSTWIDDYYLSSHLFHVRVQKFDNRIQIDVYHPPIESFSSPSSLSFFVHFIFQSPETILKFFFMGTIIKSVTHSSEILEDQIINHIIDNNLLFYNTPISLLSSAPDLILLGINRFDSSNYRIEKSVGKGFFGEVWLASYYPNSDNQINDINQFPNKVVFKQLIQENTKIEKYKEYVREVMMMNEFKFSKYFLRLLGITCISSSLFLKPEIDSDTKIEGNSLMVVIEHAPFGDLKSCLKQYQLSVTIKLNIALNIASALHNLHSNQFIHRDVRSPNIFIFCIDEDNHHQNINNHNHNNNIVIDNNNNNNVNIIENTQNLESNLLQTETERIQSALDQLSLYFSLQKNKSSPQNNNADAELQSNEYSLEQMENHCNVIRNSLHRICNLTSQSQKSEFLPITEPQSSNLISSLESPIMIDPPPSTYCNKKKIYAKLGDLGCTVMGSTYSERVGSFQYAAPEAMEGYFHIPYSNKIDVYSFGIVLWELFSEKKPFYELFDKSGYANIQEGDVLPHLRIVNDQLRPSLKDLLFENRGPRVYSRKLLEFWKSSISKLISECWDDNPESRPPFDEIKSTISKLLNYHDY